MWGANKIRVGAYYMGSIAADFWAPCADCGEYHGPYERMADAQEATLCADCDQAWHERLRWARRRSEH